MTAAEVIVVELIGLIFRLVGQEKAQAMVSAQAVILANAEADSIERARFGAPDIDSRPQP